jgi:hypothetical protein
LDIFRKFFQKIHVSLKSDKNDGYFTWKPIYIYDISPSSSHDEKRFRQKLHTKSKHTFYIQKQFSESRAFYEICEKSTADLERPQIIWCLRIACWIPKTARTHSWYVILTAFPRQQRLSERASRLRLYVRCLSCRLSK